MARGLQRGIAIIITIIMIREAHQANTDRAHESPEIMSESACRMEVGCHVCVCDEAKDLQRFPLSLLSSRETVLYLHFSLRRSTAAIVVTTTTKVPVIIKGRASLLPIPASLPSLLRLLETERRSIFPSLVLSLSHGDP